MCRGAVAVQVDIETAATDVHSGLAGGAVQNPARALAQLLNTMWDPTTYKVGERKRGGGWEWRGEERRRMLRWVSTGPPAACAAAEHSPITDAAALLV